ncbi:MAG: DUF4105 domain-containing protein [Gallionella sp.]
MAYSFLYRIVLLPALCLLPQLSYATIDHAYLAELQAQARQMKLAERPEWLKLLHYLPKLIAPGYKGLVDSRAFYWAANGKTNPQAELDATLASFYADTMESNEVQNPQCQFIARYTWLNEQLKFDTTRLPPQTCTRFDKWRTALNPSGLTLIFASAYLNSPSSMYGHTLLRIDAKNQNEQTRLLAYAVNFAASTTETNGLSFAVNGLFGGYAGAFSLMPYYAKVREYSDFENRDIWEYPLNLTPTEVDRVLMHIWELGSQYFDYFFFDENCSYHLLGLLQVARPEFQFTQNFRWGTIPVDTVREMTLHENLVARPIYRPAQSTLLNHQLALMNDQERDLIHVLSQGGVSPTDVKLTEFSISRTAKVLEASLDYVNFRHTAGKQDVADPAALSRELQGARSRLDIIAPPVDRHEPSTRPNEGHASSRIAFAAGKVGVRNFQEVSLRATYHDMMDQDAGYVRGAAIEFFSMALRHDDASATRVERVTPVNIVSLTPRDAFFHSPSWKVSGGWQRIRTKHGDEPLAAVLDGGIGGAWDNPQHSRLSYSLLDLSTRFNSSLNKGYTLGAGISIGSYMDANQAWRIHPYLNATRYFAGQRDREWQIGIEQRISLKHNLALRFDVARLREWQTFTNKANAALLVYF